MTTLDTNDDGWFNVMSNQETPSVQNLQISDSLPPREPAVDQAKETAISSMPLSEKMPITTSSPKSLSPPPPSRFQDNRNRNISVSEQNYTDHFLKTTRVHAKRQYVKLTPYQDFYYADPRAGYACYKLQEIFTNIGAALQNESKQEAQDPWEYFVDVETHGSYCTSLHELTDALYRCRWLYHEPTMIEKVRVADNSRIRREMVDRLAQCDRKLDSEVVDRLMDRHMIVERFLTNVQSERERKAMEMRRELLEGPDERPQEEKQPVGEIRRRKTSGTDPVSSDHTIKQEKESSIETGWGSVAPLVKIDMIEGAHSQDEIQRLSGIVKTVIRETLAAPVEGHYQVNVLSCPEILLLTIATRLSRNTHPMK